MKKIGTPALTTAFLLVFAIGARVASSNAAAATAPTFNVLDPVAFQQHCGQPVYRQRENSPDGTRTSLSLSLLYARGAPAGNIGVVFYGSTPNNPRDFHKVAFFSVESHHLVDQKTALSMLGCQK